MSSGRANNDCPPLRLALSSKVWDTSWRKNALVCCFFKVMTGSRSSRSGGVAAVRRTCRSSLTDMRIVRRGRSIKQIYHCIIIFPGVIIQSRFFYNMQAMRWLRGACERSRPHETDANPAKATKARRSHTIYKNSYIVFMMKLWCLRLDSICKSAFISR